MLRVGTELVLDDTFRPAPLLSQQSDQQAPGRCLDDTTAQMHPGDYADALANIVHHALHEAERRSIPGGNLSLLGIVAEITTLTSLHMLGSSRLN